MADLDYNDLSAKDLRTELRGRDLPVSGTKGVMVKRLVTADAELGCEDEEFDPDQLFGDNVIRFEAAIDRLCDAINSMGGAPTPMPTKAKAAITVAAKDLIDATESPNPAEAADDDREAIREVTRKLLTAQPDGRTRALRVLGEYGGSVSAVPANDLGRALAVLTRELNEVNFIPAP